MAATWTEARSDEYWSLRQWIRIGRDDNTTLRQLQCSGEEQNRKDRELSEQSSFTQQHVNRQQSENAPRFIPSNESEHLTFWIIHGSYKYCMDCKAILPLRLLPRFGFRPRLTRSNTCLCKDERYMSPNEEDIPDVLRNLSNAEICVLRPLTIHNGNYVRAENGYRKKDGIFQLSWSNSSIMENIHALPDLASRSRCLAAYNYLMNDPRSSYRSFVEKRDLLADSRARFNLYQSTERQDVECCLWPHLYPTRDWCATSINGTESRHSTKRSFLNKVISPILDYSTSYDLLHFHYDLWLFKTISGALSSGRFRECSPARSLETKPFAIEYWKWQHRYLVDAVLQFGPPSVFLTISPYEWSFPVPPWLASLRLLTGKGPTQLASFETIHITHVLEQIIRGYLCGSNDKKWTSHVFNYNHMSNYKNVNTYFYRFEFQSRGTVHVHLLVWLKDMKQIRLNLLRADIPWVDSVLSYRVSKLQKSDKGAIPLRNEPTQVISKDNAQLLKLYHPADAFALNLRAYISSIVPSLKCRMDVQTSDGHGMLLRYVTSYVSKWHDSFQSDELYSVHVGPYQAAYKHLLCLKPLEPEMWLALTSTKMSWTPSRRKKFTFLPVENLSQNKCYLSYLRRSKEYDHLSFLEWLRLIDETKGEEYTSGCTLVGVKMVSPLKDVFFFQHLVLNFPHSQLEHLYHRNFNQLPVQIKNFAGAYTLLHDFWSRPEKIRTYFMQQGHKAWFIETLIAHISSLADFFHLFQRRVLTSENIVQLSFDLASSIEDPLQNRFLQSVRISLRKRDEHYNQCLDDSDANVSDVDDDEDVEDVSSQSLPQQVDGQREIVQDDQIDWKKIFLLTGKAGTGKTHCVKQAIKQAIEHDRSVLVSTPTGFLATTYAAQFQDDIATDTVHSAFKYPVAATSNPEINWDLMRYDLIVIDEVSMVSKSIMQHVLSTINQIALRPVVIMCGDQCQQQPIATVDQEIRQVPSILEEKEFYSIVNHLRLTKQHRCEDQELLDILNHLRYYRPSEELLNNIHDGRVLCPSDPPSDREIERAIKEIPNATVVTVSRKAANRINQVAINCLYKEETPLMHAQCDCDLPPIPLYQNLPVIITQNRDKKNGVVNGQRATVKIVQNQTVFLTLANGLIVSTHLVTATKPDGSRKTSYPFVPAYAVTICKSQGQTLEKVIIWMDSPYLPPGAAYVALSRVRKFNDLYFLTKTHREQYRPVSAEA